MIQQDTYSAENMYGEDEANAIYRLQSNEGFLHGRGGMRTVRNEYAEITAVFGAIRCAAAAGSNGQLGIFQSARS